MGARGVLQHPCTSTPRSHSLLQGLQPIQNDHSGTAFLAGNLAETNFLDFTGNFPHQTTFFLSKITKNKEMSVEGKLYLQTTPHVRDIIIN